MTVPGHDGVPDVSAGSGTGSDVLVLENTHTRAGGTVLTPDPELAYVAHPMSITPDDLRQVRFAQQRQ